MPRPLHTDEQRERAVALAIEHGPAQAQRLLLAEGVNVKAATIRQWCSRAGVVTVTSEKAAAARAALKATSEERRARLADRMLELAEMATDHAQELIGEANLRDVVGLFTRAVHDHQLLSGNATARSEHLAPTEAAHAVLDEVAERRTA